MGKALCEKDEEIIQCYLWGLNSIWDVRTGISNNHNTDYDLEEIYEYLDMFFDKTNVLRKIAELEINPKLNVDESSFKYYLKQVVNGKLTISDLSIMAKVKRETIQHYLKKVGYSKYVSYDDWRTQLMFKKVIEGKVQITSAPVILGTDYTRFVKMLKKYKKENNIE